MQKMEDLQKQLSQSTQEMNQNKLISQETLQSIWNCKAYERNKFT